MQLKDLIRFNRSYRKYDNTFKINDSTLIEFIERSRFVPSSRNIQSIRFHIVNNQTDNDFLFEQLSWAGYLKDWDGPEESQRPSAYIIICNDNSLFKNAEIDIGIISQTILLQLAEKGLGGCMIGAFKKNNISQYFEIEDPHSVKLVIAIGKPVQEIILEDIKDNDHKYYLDGNNLHHVPKRTINELILNINQLKTNP